MTSLVKEKTRVSIFGREYELDPGHLTPLEASQLASYVDQKMKEIAQKLGLVDTQKIAVLAALNIAFELGSRKNAAAQDLPPAEEARLTSLLETLDKTLT